MNAFGNVAFALVAILAMARSFSLTMRYLQDGIAYLRHDRIVMDVAMPVQGVLVAIVATAGSLLVLHVDPGYSDGAGVLPLSVLGAAGAVGLLLPMLYLMQRSSMASSIEYHQPLFLRDRTPGCTSTRHVVVRVAGDRGTSTSIYRTVTLG